MSEAPLPELRKKAGGGSLLASLGKIVLLLGALALVFGSLWYFFGRMAFESPDPAELFSRIAGGRPEMRRMAASEWARILSAEKSEARPGPEQLPSLAKALEESVATSDPQLASSLALVLGYAAEGPDNVAARSALVEFLDRAPEGEAAFVQARVFALLSLARLGFNGPVDTAPFLKRMKDPDASIRKAVAYGLGQSLSTTVWIAGTPPPREELKSMLNDETDDVRWNAAFGLARAGDASGSAIIKELLLWAAGLQVSGTRSETEYKGELSPERFEVYRAAMQAALQLKDPELRTLVERVAQGHANIKLRQAAKALLQ